MDDERCILITNGNVLSMLSLGEWIRTADESIARVYVTRRLPSERNNFVGVWRMFLRSGWAYTHFKVWLNVIAPRWLRSKGLPGGVADLIKRWGLSIPVVAVDSVNAPPIVDDIRRLAPHYIVSFSATERFGAALLATASAGGVNTHFGALPAYAGISPYVWHLINGERRFGVTLHRMNDKLDAGPIIEQIDGEIADTRSALRLALRMTECVSPMLKRFLDRSNESAVFRVQDPAKRSYFGHPTRADMRKFSRDGFCMKDAGSVTSLLERVRHLVEND